MSILRKTIVRIAVVAALSLAPWAMASVAAQEAAAPSQPAAQPAAQPAGEARAQEPARSARGIIGIVPAVTADAIGSPAELIVRAVTPYSPAYDAGLLPGDRITSVAGKPVQGRSLRDVVADIRGEVGTRVTLTVERNGQSRDVELTRVMPVDEYGYRERERDRDRDRGGRDRD